MAEVTEVSPTVVDTDGGAAAATDLPPVPEGADQGALTLTGDDPCGHYDEVGELSGGPQPSPEGGRLVVNTSQVGPFGLSGTFWPDGDGGLVWEDRPALAGDPDNPDVQEITDIEVGDGTVTGMLTWTDHDECTSSGQLELAFPTTVTDWLLALPPRGPSLYAVQDLAIEATGDGGAVATGGAGHHRRHRRLPGRGHRGGGRRRHVAVGVGAQGAVLPGVGVRRVIPRRRVGTRFPQVPCRPTVRCRTTVAGCGCRETTAGGTFIGSP